MAAFTPLPSQGQIYTNGIDTIKIKSFDGTIAKVVFIDASGKETERTKNFPSYQWNQSKFALVNDTGGGTREKPNGNIYTFSISESGEITITNKDGKTIMSSNIKGPKGDQGVRGSQGPVGNPGRNGETYHPEVSEDGKRFYFVSEKGEKISEEWSIAGKDGQPGLQGKTGPKGEDGIYWFPELSEDGTKVRFVNRNNTTECSEWYSIKGAKGDTGGEGPQGVPGPAGPVFIPSVNADGELSWSNTGEGLVNPPSRNIKGDKGDKGDKGATFHPVIKDGVLYWYDDNGLVESISPVRIKGEQGVQGERGDRGLSAYQIWLKQGFRGTEKEFLDSLKGEKGTPAPPANFSFKDVKDYKCPVQVIDTKLIVDSEKPTKTPEEIIQERVDEIKKLREDGHNKENQKKNNVNWLKKFFWRCAGADKDLLTMCPGDHAKYVGMGSVIFFTALMAWFSSFIAMQLVFEPITIFGLEILPKALAALFATFWAAMIFCLDRFITNTMYSDGKVTISRQEFLSGLPRILIAIFLGIIISAPLELKIFFSKIELEMLKQYDNELIEAKQKARDAATKEFDNELSTTKEQKSEYEGSRSFLQTQLDELKNGAPPIGTISWGSTTISNSDGTTTTKGGGSKPDYSLYNKYMAENESKMDSLQTLIDNYTDKINKCDEHIAKADERRNQSITEAENRADTNFKQNFDKGLKRQLSILHEMATEGYTPWWTSGGKYEKGNFWDIVLHKWWWYLVSSPIGLIMLLFILIDISPVLYKMMLADGRYDNYLHQEKLLAQDKIRLSLANMLKGLDDSELKRVAPFVMGDVYSKMAGDSFVYKTEKEFKEEIEKQKGMWQGWRLWPLSWLRAIFWKENDKPSAPVIILEKKNPTYQDIELDEKNKEVFDEVLDMKKRIILASYRRWYKTQHDSIIGDDVNDENKGRDPFDDEAPEGDDSNANFEGDTESGNMA